MTIAIETCLVVVDSARNSVEVRSSAVRYKTNTQQHTTSTDGVSSQTALESSRSFGTCDSLATGADLRLDLGLASKESTRDMLENLLAT